MTKLLQQALNEAKADAIEVFTYKDGIAQSARDAIEYMHSWLGVYFEKQALAQQEQPASVDAYVGAREDAAIWKKRALEAEELNRKFIAEVNGPTYLGEPAQQEQPAQEASATWTEMVVANLVREGVNKHRARELAAHFLTLPTQQALSDDEILNCFYASKSEGMVSYMLAVGRAIEAHCRGGADK